MFEFKYEEDKRIKTDFRLVSRVAPSGRSSHQFPVMHLEGLMAAKAPEGLYALRTGKRSHVPYAVRKADIITDSITECSLLNPFSIAAGIRDFLNGYKDYNHNFLDACKLLRQHQSGLGGARIFTELPVEATHIRHVPALSA